MRVAGDWWATPSGGAPRVSFSRRSFASAALSWGSRSRRPRRWIRGSPGTDRDGGGRRRPDRPRVARRSGLCSVPPWCRGSPDGACWHRKLANQAQPWHEPTRSAHSGRGRTGRQRDPPEPFPRTPGTARGDNRRPERCRTDQLGAHALKLRDTDSASQRQRQPRGRPHRIRGSVRPQHWALAVQLGSLGLATAG
jgi:hypothetical protein